MPDVGEYLEGYGFVIGNIIEDWYITDVNSTHKQIVRYNEYDYPTTIQLTKHEDITNKDAETILDMLRKYLQRPIIIRSKSGRPYKMTANHIAISKVGKNFVDITYLGHGRRVSEAIAATIK